MRKVFIYILLLVVGCRTTPVVETKPKLQPSEMQMKQRWMTLAPHVKKHFKTDKTVKEIAAELSYAEYKLNKDKP